MPHFPQSGADKHSRPPSLQRRQRRFCGHTRHFTSATNQHLALCGFLLRSQLRAPQCHFIYSFARLLVRGATRVAPSHLPRLISHESCRPLSARLQRPGWWWIPHTAFSPSDLHKAPPCPSQLLGSVFPRMRHFFIYFFPEPLERMSSEAEICDVQNSQACPCEM